MLKEYVPARSRMVAFGLFAAAATATATVANGLALLPSPPAAASGATKIAVPVGVAKVCHLSPIISPK